MTTTAVILAAGFSTRMGADNKLVLEVGGVPVLRRVAEAVSAVCDIPPVVVLGYQNALVRPVLEGLNVTLVTNPDPAAGQASSVRLGLEAAGQADETLVVLGDQPFLTAQNLMAMLEAHRARLDNLITVPMQGEERGNPIVRPRSLKAAILSDGTKIGCGSFTRKHPELTAPYLTSELAFFRDVDTPQDLANARESHEGRVA